MEVPSGRSSLSYRHLLPPLRRAGSWTPSVAYLDTQRNGDARAQVAKGLERKIRHPVVRLVLALYGHPKPGRIWEDDCTKRVLECCVHGGKWKLVSDSWPNVVWKPKINALMLVYVDDFKVVAKAGCHDKLWNELKGVIDMCTEEENTDSWDANTLPLSAKPVK